MSICGPTCPIHECVEDREVGGFGLGREAGQNLGAHGLIGCVGLGLGEPKVREQKLVWHQRHRRPTPGRIVDQVELLFLIFGQEEGKLVRIPLLNGDPHTGTL